jgi:hypothetical protein
MRRRKLWIALAVLLVVAGIAALVYLRKRAAPEAARLLPECDAALYVNLRLIRLEHIFTAAPPISHDRDYEEFVNQTGFQFERDLDQAAVALHASSGPSDGAGGFFESAHYSEILIGKFDLERATAYLRKLANSNEQYRDAIIYVVPREGRSVRIAILGVDTVAISNTSETAAIHQMIDKYRAAARPASEPSLVHEHYRNVPLGSVAWALARMPVQSVQTGVLPGEAEMLGRWMAGSTIVASARYLRALHLRVEAVMRSQNDAQRLLETITTFFVVLKGAESSVTQGGTDADVKAFFDSLKARQEGSRVLLTATVPPGFIRKALAPPPAPQTAVPPRPESGKGKRGKTR